jgi:5-methyltetrahydropteroyltriglutamate--homocysteine methyltransferase
MRRSTDRILTTHAGSLPRPDDLLDMMQARAEGPAYQKRLREAVAEVVRKQADVGIDVMSDGEYGKPSFLSYINDRLGGFEQRQGSGQSPWATSREAASFPEYYKPQLTNTVSRQNRMVCIGPISYKGHARLQTDIDNFKVALAAVGAGEAFMPAISPSNAEEWNANNHYKTEEDYLFALADALREEYKGIVDAGFVLQIDDPRLVTYYNVTPQASLADCRKWAEVRIAALNHALRDIPTDRIRFHTCYGINIGPRIHDMELKDIIDLMLKVRAGAYSFEASNPRHEHEWEVWRGVKLTDGAILIPGVITQSTVLVEHPELIAQRIMRFADVVGRENVIAGSDCGFATFAVNKEVHERIVWAKLEALAKGAEIASRKLWGPH